MLRALRSAASTVLRRSIARVIGPTPPMRGVIQPATSATDSSTSDNSRLPSRETPAPTTAAPGLTMSGVTRFARPAAATTTSPSATYSPRFATPVWTTVTAALQPGRFSASSSARGRPIVSPRPMTTTCCPLTGTSYAPSSSTIPAGVHGSGPGAPITRRPRLTGCRPSTSFSGSTAMRVRSWSRCAGNGSWTRNASTSGFALNDRTTSSRCSWVTSPGSSSCTETIPTCAQSWCFIAT